MVIKFKRSKPDAQVPTRADKGSAGWDLYSYTRSYNLGYIEYGTGIHVEIPKGHVGLLYPRSSITTTELILANSVGVIDSSYRGEIKLRFKAIADNKYNVIEYGIGQKIGQLIVMPYPELEWQEVEELSNTDRGDGGFGSSGR